MITLTITGSNRSFFFMFWEYPRMVQSSDRWQVHLADHKSSDTKRPATVHAYVYFAICWAHSSEPKIAVCFACLRWVLFLLLWSDLPVRLCIWMLMSRGGGWMRGNISIIFQFVMPSHSHLEISTLPCPWYWMHSKRPPRTTVGGSIPLWNSVQTQVMTWLEFWFVWMMEW